MKTYKYIRQNNKNKYGYKNKQSGEILIKKYGEECNQCGINRNLQLDHIIPICFGGDEFDINNHQLLCCHCHYKKTGLESRVINIAKKIGFIKGRTPNWFSYLDTKQRVKKCLEIKSMIIKSKEWWQ